MDSVRPVFETVSETHKPQESQKSTKHKKPSFSIEIIFPETRIFVEKNGDRVAYASVSVLSVDKETASRTVLFSVSLSSKLSPGETAATACEMWRTELESLLCPDSVPEKSACPSSEDILHRAGVKEEEMAGVGKKVSSEKYDALSLFVDFWLEFPLEAPEYGSIAKKSGTERAFDAFCIRKAGASWDSLPEEKRRGLASSMRKRLEKRGTAAERRHI